jgi:hypothetical protein
MAETTTQNYDSRFREAVNKDPEHATRLKLIPVVLGARIDEETEVDVYHFKDSTYIEKINLRTGASTSWIHSPSNVSSGDRLSELSKVIGELE